jgi:hypothetical protein
VAGIVDDMSVDNNRGGFGRRSRGLWVRTICGDGNINDIGNNIPDDCLLVEKLVERRSNG